MSDNVVIIGASHAAAEAVTSLRRQGWSGAITLIGDEASLPYHRPPLSKAYFNGEIAQDKLLIKRELIYQNAAVDLMLGRRAESINRQRKIVLLDNGESVNYSKLIVATGTRARRLPLEGGDLPEVCYLRSLSDVDRIKKLLPDNGRLLIVGAGYIGLEVAASAAKQGVSVVVLESMERVLARVTSPIVSDFYQSLHAKNGVDIRLNSVLQRFENVAGTVMAVMNDGEHIKFDCAIIGIGVIPNVELAERAGIACDNGILVNEYTQTSDPDIYAVGDCSNHPSVLYKRNIRLESVPNAVDQAKIAASSICGTNVTYDQVPWFWSDQYAIKLQTVGLLTGYDQVIVRGRVENEKFSVFYLKKGQLIAMDAINSPADFMVSKKLVMSQCRPDLVRLADSDSPLKNLL